MASPGIRDSDNSHRRFPKFNNDSAGSYESSMDNLRLHWFSEGVRLGRQLQHDDDEERLSRYKTRTRAQAVKYREEVLLRKRYREEIEFLQSELFVLKDALLAAQTAYEEHSLSVATTTSSSFPGQSQSRPHSNVSSALPERHNCVNEGTEDDFHAPQKRRRIEHEIQDDQQMDGADQSRSPVEFDNFGLSACPCSSTESPPDLREPSGRTSCEQDDKGLDASEIALLMSAAHDGDPTALERVRALIHAEERIPRNIAQTQKLVHRKRKSPKALATEALRSPEALEIFVDASPYGIGFIFNNRWLAWKFIATPLLPLGPDGKLIMSWGELVAVEMGIRTLVAASFSNVVVTIHSDNEGVVKALKSGKWKEKYGLDDIVKRVLHLSGRAGLSLKMKWIPTKKNPADDASRGIYPPTDLAFHCRPSIPCNLSELIQEVG